MNLQPLVNGVVTGLGLAILGLALQLVYLPTRVLFFAIAGLFAAAPYLMVAGAQWGMPITAAAAASIVFVSAASVLMEWVSHAPLARHGATGGVQLVASLGYYTVLAQGVSAFWGSQPRLLAASSEQLMWRGAGVAVSASQVLMAVGAASIIGGVIAVLHYSRAGLRIRALADNPTQFQIIGYNPWRYRSAVFAVSGALSGAAALLFAADVGFDPAAGLNPVLYAFVGLIVGGRHAPSGAVLGCLLVGVVRAEVSWFLSARWQDATVFLLMVIFLMVIPGGMLGRRVRLEAQ